MCGTVSGEHGVASTLGLLLAIGALVLTYSVVAMGYMGPAPIPENAAAIVRLHVKSQCFMVASGVLALSSALCAALGRRSGRWRVCITWVLLAIWLLFALGAALFAFELES